jgi:hypothetical protein
LHSALAKAGRPYYHYVVRLLLEHGADVNARTLPGRETGAFMRDVRTCGETPLPAPTAPESPRLRKTSRSPEGVSVQRCKWIGLTG